MPTPPDSTKKQRIEALEAQIAALQQELTQLKDDSANSDTEPNMNENLSDRWHCFVDHSPMGIHLYRFSPEANDTGQLIFEGSNPAAEELMSTKGQEFIGKTIEEAFPSLMLSEIPDRFRKAARHGTPWHTERVQYEGETIVKALEVHVFQTEPNHMASIFWDITERKKTEALLKENERSLRQLTDIIDRSMDMISFSSMDQTVQYMNPAGRKMVGFSEDLDLATTVIHDVHPPWAFKIVQEQGIPTALEKGIWQGETALRDGKGREIPVHQTIIGHKDPVTQKPSYISTIMHDVSESRRSQEEIQRLQRFMADILNSMPSYIIAVDEDGKITHWNQRVQEAAGVPTEEVIGRPFSEVANSFKPYIHLIDIAMKTRAIQQKRHLKADVDGDIRYMDFTIFPLSDSGAVIRIDDVTEKARMEEMLIQTEKMQSVGGLAAGMAHEINNPLAAILQNLQVLNNRLSEELPKNRETAEKHSVSLAGMKQYLDERKITEMLGRIEEAGRRASELVSNMLSFSRQNSESATPQDVSQLVAKTIELVQNDFNLSHNYDFRKIQIEQNNAENLPQVECEPSKIQQVLFNVITNGAHAMLRKQYDDTEQPLLTIGIQPVSNDMNGIEISITDNGIGMNENTTRRIFEPFFTTKPVGEGTGLGLAICYYIVTQQHNGQMRVDSTPGKGTTFIVQLPLQQK